MSTADAALRKIIELWALAGGLLLLAIVLVNAASLAGNIAFHQPVPGDFEVVEVGIAVTVFMFLPYCQLTGANVTADIFTSRAGPRLLSALGILAAVVALIVAIVLLWRMSYGLADYRTYREVTTIYQFPIWYAFVPILISLTLLTAACVLSLLDAMRGQPAA
jgi:TRAP-type C4-dicarboxylate transport system permease small subunit